MNTRPGAAPGRVFASRPSTGPAPIPQPPPTMKPALALALIIASACGAPSPGGSGFDPGEVEAHVRAASATLVDALNAHDADAILDLYDLEEGFTQVVCTEVRTNPQGFANLTRALHTQFKDAVYTMRVSSVRVLGPDVAVVASEGTMTGPFFVTRVLRKAADGRWLVTWEHQSWPGCPPPVAPHPGTSPESMDGDGGNPEITGS